MTAESASIIDEKYRGGVLGDDDDAHDGDDESVGEESEGGERDEPRKSRRAGGGRATLRMSDGSSSWWGAVGVGVGGVLGRRPSSERVDARMGRLAPPLLEPGERLILSSG